MVFISQDEWAAKMGLSHRQVGDLLRAGKIPGAVKVGKYYRLPDVVVPVPDVVVPVVVDEPVLPDDVEPVDAEDPVVADSTLDNRTPAEKARDDAVLKAETSRALREAAEDDIATKKIETEMAELEQRGQITEDGEAALAKKIADVDARVADIQKREDAVAVKEASVESVAEKITQDAKDKATGIIGNATLQAGHIVTTAKDEATKVNLKLGAHRKELDKAQADLVAEQVKTTNARAVVERCLSRLDRDTKELLQYAPKDWPAKLKTLIDAVTSSLQDGS